MKKTTLVTLGVIPLMLASLMGVAAGMQQSTTPAGSAYVSGGVSDDERIEMQKTREQYSLWVLTAARKSGAYLSDVHLLITDSAKKVVFDAPILQYEATKSEDTSLQLVGPVFEKQNYAFALQQGSALREPLNQALLLLNEEGVGTTLREKYFGEME